MVEPAKERSPVAQESSAGAGGPRRGLLRGIPVGLGLRLDGRQARREGAEGVVVAGGGLAVTAREVVRGAARLPLLRRAAPTVKDIAINAGLMSYRPPAWEDDALDMHYVAGGFDYFADQDETPRYGILLGYLTYFGGRRRIIDVGCGFGLLRRRIGPYEFESYLGIDVAASSIESAAELADERTTFVVGDILTTDVGSHDVAVLNEVLYMVPDPPALLDRLVEVIEPGGLLLTSMMRHPGDRRLWAEIDTRFEPLDAVRVRHETNTVATWGWRMAAHRRLP